MIGITKKSNSGSIIEKPIHNIKKLKKMLDKKKMNFSEITSTMIGSTFIGKIASVLTKGKSKYGFILFKRNNYEEHETRIYFNFSNYTMLNEFPPKRNYLITFECMKDELDRYYASNVRFTPEGLEQVTTTKKDNSEKQIKINKNHKFVSLICKCHGINEEKVINVNLSKSIGKLKHDCIVAFNVPIDYKVYSCITNENPISMLLTKESLNKLVDNDIIQILPHLDA